MIVNCIVVKPKVLLLQLLREVQNINLWVCVLRIYVFVVSFLRLYL